LTIAHAADVAHGHLLAAGRGIAGERYILGGECLTIPDYFSLIARICTRTPPRVIVPRWAMLGIGAAFSFARLLGVQSVPFAFGQIHNIVGRYAWYSSDKARSALDYKWRPASEAIEDYVNWVRSGRPVSWT
jgi:dihydroflavonol-4-reductase